MTVESTSVVSDKSGEVVGDVLGQAMEAAASSPVAGGETLAEAPATAEVAEEVSVAPEKSVEAPRAPSEASDTADRMKRVMRAFGDIPDTPSDKLLESIDEKSVERLPDSMKGLMRHLIARERAEAAKRQADYDKQVQALSDREKQLKADARALIRNRAQLNQVLLDPKFQELLKNADLKEEDLGAPLSEDGIQKRVSKRVAQAMKEFSRPITDAAVRAQQMAKYNDFVEAHPKMQERGFKREVREFMEKRQGAGAPVSLEDAYELIDRRRMVQAEKARQTKERKARAESARKVQRQTVSSQPDAGEPVPKWVMEKGYKGARGQLARIYYLKDHPKALEKLRSQQRSRRRG